MHSHSNKILTIFYFSNDFPVPYAKTARILILMSIPGQILFIYLADYIHMSKSTIGLPFIASYLAVSLLQVRIESISFAYSIVERPNHWSDFIFFHFQICTLLYIAHIMIHVMWKYKIDPDNSAIPYLTALGDLFGSSLLAIAFLIMSGIGQPYGGGGGVHESIIPPNGIYPSINWIVLPNGTNRKDKIVKIALKSYPVRQKHFKFAEWIVFSFFFLLPKPHLLESVLLTRNVVQS